MEILSQMGADGHEQSMVVFDPGAGLKAIIAIHDTILGPAAGGTRMWPYESEEEAIWDALRLSRAMTCKLAAAQPRSHSLTAYPNTLGLAVWPDTIERMTTKRAGSSCRFFLG